jgi:uncharacterized RDD family membrane protein YckC
MSENPLVAPDVAQDTALAVPTMGTGAPHLRRSPQPVALRSVPALEALPPMARPVSDDDTARLASPDVDAVRAPRVPPPSSRDMSSPGRRLRAQALDAVLFVVTAGVGWVAWSAVTWRHGQTPAKRLLRMRCIDTRVGSAAGFRTMACREVGLKWVPSILTLGLGLVVGGAACLGERREALWDKAGKTIVIDDPRGRYRPDRSTSRRRPAGRRARAA